MEHEVFVPVPARQLRAALADPARVARAIPGLQREAGEDALAGRLKVRIGKHSVTYRGSLRVTGRDDGTYAVAGEGTEVRGTGSAGLALTLRVRDAEGGAVLAFEGTATAGGRVAELAPESVSTAVTRLLNRFAEALAEQGPAEDGEPPQTAETLATQDFAPLATGDFETTPDAEDAPVPPAAAAEPARDAGNASSPPTREAGDADAPEGAGAGDAPAVPAASSVFEAEVPPPSLDPLADEEEGGLGEEAPEVRDEEAEEQAERDDVLEPALPEGAGEELSEPLPEDAAEDFGEPAEPPAEAAHARRTMIGRSAEEVDHAPPRGRYAPVPAPLTVSGNPALRWAAPAAALAVASAIIVGRALRRRR